MKKIWIVRDDQAEEIRKWSYENRKPESEFVRRAIDEKLEREAA